MLSFVTMNVRTEEEWRTILRKAPFGIIPGTPRAILHQGKQLRKYLLSQHTIKEGDHILDLGCGIGRMAIALSTKNIRYDGIDIVPICIDFCRENFKPWRNFLFKLLDVRNSKYRKHALLSPRQMRLPYQDETFDAVLAISVFTHIGDAQARDRYLSEIYRVLKKNGQAYITWFKSPPNECCYDDERTVFLETDILNAVRNFDIIDSAGGTTNAHHDQWVMHLKKSG